MIDLKKITLGDLIIILGIVGSCAVGFYKLSLIQDAIIQQKLEIGQIKQKLISSNQVVMDIVNNSKISETFKIEVKHRFDDINSKWDQYLEGGKVKGPAFSNDSDSTKPTK